ncbi:MULTISPECIES: 2-oxoacid:acceptor oxidoreductase subunit alpha [Methanoculleus]|uniref:Pyruvate flavodoxin/ferredoxin oxidoreductase domain protein n=2 Tax=Methanoculleus TaxID=45989 RepID=A3CX57_METMJ|nr:MULTISPECIES: 2-oxoacid:acceptor oxidoreductase subunit alpha [Methanoculleus]ABN57957.1 pyruvate flavodoxin/ferredoxin oxidoreductase domain protein [Methanoculleus marisnigri JR1]MCC7556206.1 2-oxoacid:acceptor oxidoreductase subunit alpha [Methanoculleus marisnigri]UYU19340.1 2-oxoacid:acceptor oxidoreductase subunit alpha [Methanoculleus submarinus]
MAEYSVLIGGKAGEGINTAGLSIAGLFSHLGYRTYMYFDYPSLIRGGHNFAIVRAADRAIGAHRTRVDVLLAFDQNSIENHRQRIHDGTTVVYDASQVVRGEGYGLPLDAIVKEEKAPPITKNSAMLGALARVAGIGREVLEDVLRATVPEKHLEANLRVAGRGYNAVGGVFTVEPLDAPALPVLTGNEVAGLGLVHGGLDSYVAYPMTPSSSLLHFLANRAEDLAIRVIHPENEIGVILMALGLAYAGEKTAVGTSGGGFCLMTEGLSLAGMSEIPVTIVMGQRPGPSTGIPTYTSQTDLHFVLNAGQGEFPRLVVAPGDLEETYAWSSAALMLSWRYQVPAIVLTDKTLAEGAYSFDIGAIIPPPDREPVLWDGAGEYRRYVQTEDGVSPLAFPGREGAIVKASSYAHDEAGFTTEDPTEARELQEKLLRKGESLKEELATYPAVMTYGARDAGMTIACWGSQKWACIEAAEEFGARVVQPLVLSPFPARQWKEAMIGAGKVACVENNATGQLARLLRQHGFDQGRPVLKYDGRPFAVDELEARLAEVFA